MGSGDVWANKSIIERIGGILGKKVDFQYVDDRLGHDRRYSLNTNKLEMKMKTYRLTTKSLDKFLIERFG